MTTMHLEDIDAPPPGKAAVCKLVYVQGGMQITNEISNVTCEDCLSRAIRSSVYSGKSLVVQALTMQLGMISMRKRHPQIAEELDRAGDVARINAEIREGLADFEFSPSQMRIDSPPYLTEAERGTAEAPVMVDLPPDAAQEAYDGVAALQTQVLYLDHVHRASDGRCIKNRFARTCTADQTPGWHHDAAGAPVFDGAYTCPTKCAPGCEAVCHEVHELLLARQHDVTECATKSRDDRDAEVVASMPGTGPCPCGGQYNAFGRCTSCGKVD